MNNKLSRKAILIACYEYLLVTLPVGIYVSLEALHKEDSAFYLTSPEWAIATIFLSFQGLSLYRRNLEKTGGKLSEALFGVLALLALLLIIVASVNAYHSLLSNTRGGVIFRLVLFAIASIAFLVFVGSSKLVLLIREKENNG